VSPTGWNLQSVLIGWRCWGQPLRHRSTSLARGLPTMLMAAGVVVSTNRSKRVTPTACSMVNGPASARLTAALLALVEGRVHARRLRSEGATRPKGLFDARKCSASPCCIGSNPIVAGHREATVDICSPRERVICSRPERLGLPWCAGPGGLRFGDGTPTPTVVVTSL